MRHCIWKCALLIAIAFARPSLATIVYSVEGSTYNQNFDSLAASGENNEWPSGTSMEGWQLYRVTANNNATPVVVNHYNASNGSNEVGHFYSFGNSSQSFERALGGVGNPVFGLPDDRPPGALSFQTAGWIAASFTNATGSELTNITFSYDGEQWRNGGNDDGVAQTMTVEYAFGSDFATIPSNQWVVPGGTFSFTSPTNTGADGALDGNSSANRRADRGGTLSNLDWQSGSTLWLRWVERNDSGGDHGLAIDNFQFSAGASISAVPEGSAFLLGGIACAAFGAIEVLRRKFGGWLK